MADTTEPKSSSLHPAYTVTNIQQRIRILDGVKLSYHSWVRLFWLHATGFDVLHHIDGSPPPAESSPEYLTWKKLDAIVLQWIYATLSDDLFDRVLVDRSTAHEAWKRVENIFLNNKGSRAAALQHELSSITLASMPSIEAYCQRIRELADQLTAVDCPVNNTQRVIYLARGLPREYDAIGSSLNRNLPPWVKKCVCWGWLVWVMVGEFGFIKNNVSREDCFSTRQFKATIPTKIGRVTEEYTWCGAGG